MRGKRGVRFLVLFSVLTTTCLASIGGGPSSAVAADKPNFVLVLTDDMRYDDLQFMPNVRTLLGDQGISFDRYYDSVPLCCPARVSIWRGQYSHNTGVLTNTPATGGFAKTYSSGIEAATVATALQAAGYTTGLFGKYMNGYPGAAPADYVPPGWDDWRSPLDGGYKQYGYTLNENGTPVSYGTDPEDYGNDVYMRHASAFIDRAVADDKPFFAFLPVFAPHEPATAAPQDLNKFSTLKAPRDPSFDEADVSDKPLYIRQQPRLTDKRKSQIDVAYRRRARSLLAVDRGVAALVEQLRANGQLDNTYVIFTSDNGYHMGQHRLPGGKRHAYETDIHLPLLIRGPGIEAGAHRSSLAVNIDLAPTLVDLAGTTMPFDPDGRSLVPLFGAALPAGEPWRQSVLVEHWKDVTAETGAEFRFEDGDSGDRLPEFHGVRTARYTYVEYTTGEKELYDNVQDPYQLKNVANKRPVIANALKQRVDALVPCVGADCRAAEDAAVPA